MNDRANHQQINDTNMLEKKLELMSDSLPVQ